MGYRLIYDSGSYIDGTDVSSIEEGLARGRELLIDMMVAEMSEAYWYEKTVVCSREQIDSWDYMIDNCCVYVQSEDGQDEWSLTDDELKEIGWVHWKDRF